MTEPKILKQRINWLMPIAILNRAYKEAAYYGLSITSFIVNCINFWLEHHKRD